MLSLAVSSSEVNFPLESTDRCCFCFEMSYVKDGPIQGSCVVSGLFFRSLWPILLLPKMCQRGFPESAWINVLFCLVKWSTSPFFIYFLISLFTYTKIFFV